MLFDPNTLRDGFKATGKKYVMGARVNGQRQDGIPRRAAGRGNAACGPGALKESAKPLNLVVYADTDMLTDYLWVHTQSVFGNASSRCLPTTATSS